MSGQILWAQKSREKGETYSRPQLLGGKLQVRGLVGHTVDQEAGQENGKVEQAGPEQQACCCIAG